MINRRIFSCWKEFATRYSTRRDEIFLLNFYSRMEITEGITSSLKHDWFLSCVSCDIYGYFISLFLHCILVSIVCNDKVNSPCTLIYIQSIKNKDFPCDAICIVNDMQNVQDYIKVLMKPLQERRVTDSGMSMAAKMDKCRQRWINEQEDDIKYYRFGAYIIPVIRKSVFLIAGMINLSLHVGVSYINPADYLCAIDCALLIHIRNMGSQHLRSGLLRKLNFFLSKSAINEKLCFDSVFV